MRSNVRVLYAVRAHDSARACATVSLHHARRHHVRGLYAQRCARAQLCAPLAPRAAEPIATARRRTARSVVAAAAA